MSKKQDMFYFEKFIESAEASCEAAQLLKRSLENFRPEDISKCMDEIHEVEHTADRKTSDHGQSGESVYRSH